MKRLATLLSLTIIACAHAAREPLSINDRRQLFVDHTFLQDADNVELLVHRPEKTHEKLIVCEYPWEQRLGYYHCVLKDGDTYHLWYTVCQETDDVDVVLRRIAYARSSDGIHWVKPMLGLVEVCGTRQNNIVLGPGFGGLKGATHGCMIFLDPKAPPSERFRLVSNPAELGKKLQIFSSPDGIHWTVTHRDIMGFRSEKHHLDTQNVIFYDTRIGKYVAWVRRNLRPTASQGRSIARAESDDLSRFPDVEDCPIVLQFDAEDPTARHPALGEPIQTLDFYTNATIKYPWADNAYFMFPSAYFHFMPFLKDYQKGQPVNAGSLDIRFAAGPDGIRWNRFDREPFVDTGFKGEWDALSLYMAHGLVPAANDERLMYMYYVGGNTLHGWDRPDHRNRDHNNRLLTKAGFAPDPEHYAISRLVLRRDGFISVHAPYAGGRFTTPPLRFEGSELVLNVDTSAAGLVQVEILNNAGKPITGFTLADSDEIYTANEINRPVTFNGGKDLASLAGRTIRLRFTMRDADLYAFQFRKTVEK